MADSYAVLARGQIGSGAGNLAAPASGKQWVVSYMSFVNVHASTTYWMKVWVNGSDDAHIWLPQRNLAPAEQFEWGSGSLATLNGTASDTIQGIAQAASVINYLIMGDEIS